MGMGGALLEAELAPTATDCEAQKQEQGDIVCSWGTALSDSLPNSPQAVVQL